MCGIAGWVDWREDLTRQRAVLEAMGSRLARRGPDAAGLWLSARCGLVHRRLVVVDPEGGAQPMARDEGGRRCVITYNGELYNTEELRRELAGRGYRFRSRSDTEVLLTAYMEWGPACLARLNGIFAFGVWDEAAQTLFLARDRLGVKPLFYARRGSAFLFASEQKALLAHPRVKPEVDEEGLNEIFAVGPGRTPGHGLFRGVAELRAGCWLAVRPTGVRRGRYWSLPCRRHREGPAETAAQVRWLLQDAVERQLVSDVPVGAFLSGGIDSSAVSALAAVALARQGRGPLATFSVEYAGDESYFRPNPFEPEADGPWARLVAAWLGSRHQVVRLDPRELAVTLDEAMTARDAPGMADVDTSLYLFCREVRGTVTVALSGEGADELFGGYPWFREEAPSPGGFPWLRMVRERAALLAPWVREILRPEEYAAERHRAALAEAPSLPGEAETDARLRRVAYLSLTRFLATLLERKDRMSMASGLEVRVPFLDHRLVEYAWNIPWEIRSAGGAPKGILRLALASMLPREVLERRKSPYPKTHHPVFLEMVRARFLALLDDPASPLVPLLDAARLREMAAGSLEMAVPFFGQLMRGPQLLAYLLQVDAWLRAYRVRVVLPQARGRRRRAAVTSSRG